MDGAGRDIEYLLINILDPNRVVGQPYFIRRLSLKNGRLEEGLLAAEDPQTITLKGENDALRIFARKDVAEVEVVERLHDAGRAGQGDDGAGFPRPGALPDGGPVCDKRDGHDSDPNATGI